MAQERLDRFDRKILQHIQIRGDLGPGELSTLVHLSPSQCSRRLHRLREQGFIERTAAILDPAKLNLGISAYIAVKLRSQTGEAERLFRARIEALPEVISCDYTTGEMDFMLRIYTHDLESYSEFLSAKLLIGEEIDNVRTFIVMKQLKKTTALPLDFC
ncbi:MULTISPECIES: Lrp/AsnC family transcriptional regulator [unclassified Novosphingobium]|uniref:Lrp/AsnC family transcriptional regulator n=1 Tax=unclassified Novosphingobium TaxID=2644732 RepID=UPI00086CE6C5|nr:MULTISPECIES: Lrp/AsnC family transcriptional regulator [unclassified Novosphingobium]MBF5092739.1 Lrp/AsnC family transcriptional regulator [Novosphingobium sp. NBM11]ODU72235.1 MAG: AsnC family transcriptional regulator [Novosphingobium sp. SCN 66-18]RQW44992.1 Lrp/AsnC family transcriptional regulator [Novosphingobium sp. LASN5T]